MKQRGIKVLSISIGLLIMALGLHLFLIPAHLAVGGVTGLVMVIKAFIPSVNIGLLMLIFNVLLFILAFIVIGFEFGGYTIYCSFALSGILGFLEALFPMTAPAAKDIVLNLVFGIVIQGVGMAIIFSQNASTGGTDIIAKIINSLTGIKIGSSLFLADALITLLAGLTFGLELGLYAFLGILLNAMVIDKAIAKFDEKVQVLVISSENTSIMDFVHDEMGRGSTCFAGYGGYTQKEQQILSVVMRSKELSGFRKAIYRIDPKAFITVNALHDVYGEGFTPGY